MKSTADAAVLETLLARLDTVSPRLARQWGTMTAHQMLVHVAGGADAVLARSPFPVEDGPPRRVMKWFALSLPLRWPHGFKSGAEPADLVLEEAEFDRDRERAIQSVSDVAAVPQNELRDRHPIFGPMSWQDWQRWSFLHADHHLRQFGA